MKKFLLLTFISGVLFGLTACSNDNPDTIKLDKNQPQTVTLGANANSGSISFYAPDEWYAYVDSQSRASEDIDWIHLDISEGGAGNVVLSFTMEENETGESRTAYIIINCGGKSVVITIIQSYLDNPGNDDGDDDLINGPVFSSSMRYVFPHFMPLNIDGNYITMNNDGYVVKITGNDGYLTLSYDGPKVFAESSYGYEYMLYRGGPYQFCTYLGVYKDDELLVYYDLKYDTEGYLRNVAENVQGDVVETWDLTWEDGNVTEVTMSSGGVNATTYFEYNGTTQNRASVMLYGSQMSIGNDELEFFYYCGLLGLPTASLISSSLSVAGNDAYNSSATYEYKYDAKYCPIEMTQTKSEGGHVTSTSIYDFEWKEI